MTITDGGHEGDETAMIANELDGVIKKYDWGKLFTENGDASEIPSRLLGLINAQDEASAKRWYYLLEYFIVVSGRVYESAFPSIDVLISALKQHPLSDMAVSYIYELIYQIVNGATSADAIRRGNASECEKCKQLVSQNLELLKSKCPSIAAEILEWIMKKL